MMDSTERIVLAHLESLGIFGSAYEPDGNMPPDFAWRRIAIEARRLNQHDDRGRGLEEDAVPLVMKVEKLLQKAASPAGRSWFVTVRFKRPLPPWKPLAAWIAQVLSAFDPVREQADRHMFRLSGHFSLEIAASSVVFDRTFVLGGWTDFDSGGFVVAEVIKSLNRVLAEKTRKVSSYTDRYEAWWLALVDHISYAHLSADDVDVICQHVAVSRTWSRVVLIDPLNPSHHVTIKG